MASTFEIDVSGSDVFDRDFSIALIYNNYEKYGFKFKKHLQDTLIHNYKQGEYCINNKKSLKPRVYSSILILLLKSVAREQKLDKEYKFYICDDLYGHFNQICDLLVTHLQKEFPKLSKKKHISKCKHPEDSLIQKTAYDIYKGRLEGITIHDFKLEEIANILSKCKIKL